MIKIFYHDNSGVFVGTKTSNAIKCEEMSSNMLQSDSWHTDTVTCMLLQQAVRCSKLLETACMINTKRQGLLHEEFFHPASWVSELALIRCEVLVMNLEASTQCLCSCVLTLFIIFWQYNNINNILATLSC